MCINIMNLITLKPEDRKKVKFMLFICVQILFMQNEFIYVYLSFPKDLVNIIDLKLNS